MSGRYVPSVRFPLYIEECKEAYVKVEPIFCQGGYGIVVKVVLTLTKETGKNKYEYDRTVREEILTQSSLSENHFYETTYEFLEGFYFNKVSQDVVVPLVAMILNVYFPDLIELCQLDLSSYFTNINGPSKSAMGYN